MQEPLFPKRVRVPRGTAPPTHSLLWNRSRTGSHTRVTRFCLPGRASSRLSSKHSGRVSRGPLCGQREQDDIQPLWLVCCRDHRRREQGDSVWGSPALGVAFCFGVLCSFRSHGAESVLWPVSLCWTALLPLGSVAPGTLAGVYVKGVRTPRVVQRKGRLTDTVALSEISVSTPNARPCGGWDNPLHTV